MPPAQRRTVSLPASPNVNNSNINAFPSPIIPRRRVVSASTSPYPNTRQQVIAARNHTKSVQRTRQVLAEIPWWTVMSGQRDESYEESESESDTESNLYYDGGDELGDEPSDIEDDRSVRSDSQESVYDVSTETASQATEEEEPFFPKTLPRLTPLLLPQGAPEPSRKPSNNNSPRTPTAKPDWDQISASILLSGSPILPSTSRRAMFQHDFSVAPDSVSDAILREALGSCKAARTSGDLAPRWKQKTMLPILTPFLTSPSALTFR